MLPEPQHGLQVEVVGGLVQEKHVGPEEERRRNRDAHPPPAAEGGDGLRHHPLVKLKPAEDGCGAAGRAVRIDRLQRLVDLVKLLPRAELPRPAKELRPLSVRLDDRVERGGALHAAAGGDLVGRVLGDVQDAELLGDPGDASGRERGEERALAHAVAPHEAVPVPVHQAEHCRVEEVLPAAVGREGELRDEHVARVGHPSAALPGDFHRRTAGERRGGRGRRGASHTHRLPFCAAVPFPGIAPAVESQSLRCRLPRASILLRPDHRPLLPASLFLLEEHREVAGRSLAEAEAGSCFGVSRAPERLRSNPI
mmetsp:Transcript_31492/g.74845  ORF Transcript_31492/g.74845 Transcript_31492/m.74845 type:complete len:311 (-) Transcript_31492:519-1451(-)